MPAARAALTDASSADLVAAPASTRRIAVYAMAGSNAGASLSVLDLKDNTTAKFSFAMAANGGGFAVNFSKEKPWVLGAGVALKVQQSQAVASYVSVIYELVGAEG